MYNYTLRDSGYALKKVAMYMYLFTFMYTVQYSFVCDWLMLPSPLPFLLPQNSTGVTPFYLHFSFYHAHDV